MTPTLAGSCATTMLFKTQSAAVYGIDAYLVEVEVDVGSARMQDFNVVGLPDNAVKESRERIHPGCTEKPHLEDASNRRSSPL